MLSPLLRNRLSRQLLAIGRFIQANESALIDTLLSLDASHFSTILTTGPLANQMIDARLAHRELRILSGDLRQLAAEHGLSVPEILGALHAELNLEYPVNG